MIKFERMIQPQKLIARLLIAVASVLLLFLTVVGSAYGQQAAGLPTEVLIGAASPGGTYYAWGAGISTLIHEAFDKQVTASVTVTGGTVHNVSLVDLGRVDIGLSVNPTVAEAYDGIGWAEGKKMTNIRVVFMAYPLYFHIYALESRSINTVQDLNNKEVAIGEPGSSHNAYSRMMFDALGIKPKRLHNLPWGDASGLLKDGLVDACIQTVGVPNSTVLELEASHKLKLIPISDAEADTFLSIHPFFSRMTLPGGNYKCVPEGLCTVGSYAMVFVHKDMSEEFVYEFVKAAYERKDTLVAAHKSASSMDPANVVDSMIPIHKGALRYYREVGIKIPDALIPPEAK